MNVKREGLYLCTTYCGQSDKKIEKVLLRKWAWEFDESGDLYRREKMRWYEFAGGAFDYQWAWKVLKARKLPK